VRAQEGTPAIEVQQFHPSPDLSGGIVTQGSSSLKPGRLNLGLWVNYADDPLVVVQNGEDLYKLQDGVLGFNLVGAVGIVGGLQLQANVPFTAYQAVSLDNPYALDAAATVLHDINLGLRLKLLDRMVRPLGLALAGNVWLPTGDPSSYTGGLFSAAGSLLLDKQVGRLWLGANAGYRYRPSLQQLYNLEVDDELFYRAGIGIARSKYYFSGDLFGAVGLQALSNETVADAPLELMLGVSRTLRNKATLSLGASTALIAGYGAPDFRVTLGITWGARMRSDRDGDGLYDEVDACPDEPEDKDGFEDADGCPDPDNDKDGIPDVNDGCPNDPEDKDGFEDADGCPDPDNDKDGIPDVKDKCPNEPEDKDGFEDTDGCPDPDNDKDGIPDVKDKCPNEPESRNSFEDEDGCPDVKVTVPDIVAEPQRLVLLEIIYFEFDKDVIKTESYPILDQAIQVFKDNSDLRVRIEGHTDAKGSDEYNMDLSTRRARSVMGYLIERGGIDPARLEAVGRGESAPITTNETDEGRAKNRRIEWVLLRP